MPLQETSGTASYDAFGGGAPVAAKYIEDFFQTWLRTGTGSSTTVTTGLNGAINETMVWTKSRSAATNHKLTDNVRGATKALSSNTTGAEVTDSQGLTAFSSTGYTIGTNTDYNNSGATYVDWQWVATPKFFDVVTWTGDGVSTGRVISHSLTSTPGSIIARNYSSASNWQVYHRSLSLGQRLTLNNTSAASVDESIFGNGTTGVAPTSTGFTVGISLNVSGQTYVAYLFAHDAGGFGAAGTDNVISCGSVTSSASGPVEVNLGYEPQWILYKPSNATVDWYVVDNMRGWTANTTEQALRPNSSAAETTNGNTRPTSTGFVIDPGAAYTWIYIAIRRGPMKTPTSGTSVFSPVTYTGTGVTNTIISANAPFDLAIIKNAGRAFSGGEVWFDRLRGPTQGFRSDLVDAEVTSAVGFDFSSFNQTGFTLGASSNWALNASTRTGIAWNFRRAPGFFDEVCYTGTGSNTTQTHNLGVAPELIIVKRRDTTAAWDTYSAALSNTEYLVVNTTAAKATGATRWNSTTPTSTVFSLGTSTTTNASGGTYVAYLFATVAGVSKVGSYTGTGTTKQIDCGFTGGARFVLIKRTDSTGDWYVWDSARGIVAGNDPYLLLNSTAAEVTSTDYVDTYSAGFEISSTAPAAINANGGTFIFLAIA